MRRAARTDAVQQSIVEGLRDMGLRVEIIGRPVDLLVGRCVSEAFYAPEFKMAPEFEYEWTILECKTPTQNGKRRARADQKAQDAFIAETGCKVVTSLESAVEALPKGWVLEMPK